MIIHSDTSTEVTGNGISDAIDFRIKASPKAFKILSGFYSDPIGAIPRELGANAWDAMVKAGTTDKQFIVHVPNTLEPWYSIRDFGTGMSDEAVKQVYTTYFDSTKTDDNDSDGCMGLGSKTPLNYTQNFIVASYFNGKKTVYNIFLSERSIPRLATMAQENTNEPNGMEIRFSVDAKDIAMFADKIGLAYASFKHKPLIIGADNVVIARTVPIFSGKNWEILEGKSRRGYGRVWKLYMGNYSYDISFDLVFKSAHFLSLPNEVRDRIYHLANRYYGGIDVNIGDVEVAPNKESLQYGVDDITAKKVCDRFEEISREIVLRQLAALQKISDEEPNDNDFLCKVQDIVAGCEPDTLAIAFGKRKHTSGDVLTRRRRLMLKMDNRGYSEFRTTKCQYQRCQLVNGRVKLTEMRFGVPTHYNDYLLFYSGSGMFSEKIVRARIRCYLMRPENLQEGRTRKIGVFCSSFFAKKMIRFFGLDTSKNAKIVDIDSIVIPKAPRKKYEQKPTSVEIATPSKQLSYEFSITHKSNWTNESPESPLYYFATQFGTVEQFSSCSCDRLAMIARIVGIVPENTAVYFVSATNAYVLKTGKWVDLQPLLVAKLLKISTSSDFVATRFCAELHDTRAEQRDSQKIYNASLRNVFLAVDFYSSEEGAGYKNFLSKRMVSALRKLTALVPSNYCANMNTSVQNFISSIAPTLTSEVLSHLCNPLSFFREICMLIRRSGAIEFSDNKVAELVTKYHHSKSKVVFTLADTSALDDIQLITSDFAKHLLFSYVLSGDKSKKSLDILPKHS